MYVHSQGPDREGVMELGGEGRKHSREKTKAMFSSTDVVSP